MSIADAFIDALTSGRELSLLVWGDLFGCRDLDEHGSHAIMGGDCTMGGDSIPDGDETMDEGNGWNGTGYWGANEGIIMYPMTSELMYNVVLFF